MRADKCGKCSAPLDAGAAFCSKCQAPVEAPRAIVAPTQPVKGEVVQAPAAPIFPMWTPAKLLWVGGLINILLKRKDLDPLDDEEKKELHEALTPVMNKYLAPAGPYADEIRLLITAGTMIGVRMYVLYVIIPEREEKKKKREQEEKRERDSQKK